MALQLLLNTSFEAGIGTTATSWVVSGTGGGTADRNPGAAGEASQKAHTGSFFEFLVAPSANATATVRQTVFLPLLPGSNLKLSFFARRAVAGNAAEDTLSAFIDLVTIFGTITAAALIAPPAAAPAASNSVYEYYELYSPPLPLGVIGATARITLGPTGAATDYAVDDVNLYYDVI